MKETKELTTKITIPTIDLPMIDPSFPKKALTENDQEYILQTSKLLVRVPKGGNAQNTIIFENGDRRATFVFYTSTTMQVSAIEDNDQALLFTNILGNDELLLEVKGKDVNLAFKIKEGFKNTGYPIQLNLEHLIVVKDYTNNLIVLKDERTREEVFTFEYPFIKDASNHMCNQIEMTVSQKEGQYFLGLVLPTTWMKREEQSYPFTLETRFNANEAMDDTVVTMTVNENGSASYQSDGKCTLGYTSDQIHRVVIFVNSLRIVQNIVQNQLDNYRVNLLLTYEEGERYQNSTGFVLYHKDGVVLRSLMQDEDHKLKVDITSYIKQEVKKYQQNQEVSTLQFTFFHDYDFLGSIEDTHFTGTDYIRIHNGAANSSFQRPYVEVKESNQYEEVRSYSMLEGGTTSISLNTKEVSHDINLGEIKEGSLSIPITLRYQDSYRKRQELKNLPTHLGKGWHFNIEQRLEKERVLSSRTNGTKIVYYDGQNKGHEFVEKWYFKEGSIKKYVSKNEVFFSMDGSLSYQDKEGKIHKVFYEAESEEGLTYLSKASIYSYPQKNVLKLKEHYYIRLSDGNLFEVYKNENGQLLIPLIMGNETTYVKDTEEKDYVISDFVDKSSDKKYSVSVTMPDGLVYDDGILYISGNAIQEVTYKEFPLLLNNGKYSIPKLKRIIRIKSGTAVIFEYESYSEEIEIIYQPTYEFQVASEEEYMNEDVMKIDENMKSYEERISTYKEKIKELSSSIISSKQYAECYRLYYLLNFHKTYQEFFGNLNEANEYRPELIKSRVEEHQNNYVQKLQELASYGKALPQLEYQYQLLKERKEALLKEEKDEVRDIIVDQSNNVLGFDKEGRLVLIQSAKEEKLALEYEGDDLLSIHGEQEKVLFSYNNEHQLVTMQNELGVLTKFQLEADDLVQVNFVKEKNETHTVSFVYSNHKLSHIEDFSGFMHDITYNATSIVIAQKTKTKQISKSTTLLLEEPRIIVQEKIEKSTDSSTCTVTNMLTTQSIVYEFDQVGNVIRMQKKTPTQNKEKETTTYHYEGDHLRFVANYKDYQLLKTIENTSTNTSNQKEITLSIGNEVTKDLRISSLPTFGAYYLTFNLVLEAAILNGLKVILCVKVTDKDGNIREYQENMEGKISSHMGIPFGLKDTDTSIQIALQMNQNLALSSIQNMELYLANTSVYEYNDQKQLVKEISGVEEVSYGEFVEEQPTYVSKTDGYGNISYVRYSIDNDGKVMRTVDEKGREVSYLYDEEGRVIEERSYHSSAPLEARVKRYIYDEKGHRQLISNGRTMNQKELYQELVTYPNTDLLRYTRSPRGVKTNYGYDFHTGELTQMGADNHGVMNTTLMSYRFGLLTSLEHHGMNILYYYDGRGRIVKRIIPGGFEVATTYEDPSLSPDPIYPDKKRITSKVTTTTNGTQQVITTYNENGKVMQVKNGNTDTIDYAYNNDGTLREIIGAGEMISFVYFKKTESVKSKTISSASYMCKFENTLDEKGRVKNYSIQLGNITTSHTYTYNSISQLSKDAVSISSLKNGASVTQSYSYSYDALSRIKEITAFQGSKLLYKNQYKYLQNDDCTFDLVTSHKVIIPNKGTVETQYTYDEENQISTIQKGNQKTRYQYDGLNRLIREDNEELNQTITYQYDEGGNLKFVRKYAYTLNEDLSNPLEEKKFTYSSKWKDQLVKVDNEVVTYDTMGRMNKIGNDVLTWNGKGQLTSYKNISFTYDVRNLRRTKGNLTYYYDGNGHILGEKGTKSINGVNQEIEIIYTYNMDKITGFVYNGVGYFYLRNIQGDILSIYKSEDLSLVASYQYDAWGNHTVTNYGEENIGNINPIRYRGYYYDEETGLYYLNSRYYDPRLRRLISPDTLSILDETMSEINGLNLYMYCKDNPVMYVDPSGCFPVLTAILCVITLAGIGLTITGKIFNNETLKNIGDSIISASQIIAGITLISTGVGGGIGITLLGTGIGSFTNGLITMSNGGSFHAGWIGGQVSGLISFIPYFGGAIGAFVGSALTDLIDNNYNFNRIDWKKAGASAGIAFALSWLANSIQLSGESLSKPAQFILSYDYALLSIANSILNVYWRE